MQGDIPMNSYVVHVACWINQLRTKGQIIELSDDDAAQPLKDRWITKVGDKVDVKTKKNNTMSKPVTDNG
jgi:hypothetical protein